MTDDSLLAGTAPDRQADQRLLDAILGFVAASEAPEIRLFRDDVAQWGEDWTEVAPQALPASETLLRTLDLAAPGTRGLLGAFARERASRKWEQSYTRADGVVGDDMLAGYGFAEVIGKLGPFVSTRVRAGIGVWGPGIDYPAHRHQPEEVYLVLGGSAEFHIDGQAPRLCRAGEAVYVTPMLTHGFRTLNEPLAVFYIWRAGDLREKSSFG
jgi:mannose-6-phosphate isomerase-like protein (cupin superfamily)